MALTMLEKTSDHADISAWPPAIAAEFERERANNNPCVGTELLSENERTRVWIIRLAPGERVGFHRHVLDYFWTCVTGGRGRQHVNDGKTVEYTYAPGETRHETLRRRRVQGARSGKYRRQGDGLHDRRIPRQRQQADGASRTGAARRVRRRLFACRRLRGPGAVGLARNNNWLRGRAGRGMVFSFDLLINAIVSGILIGAFYAAVTAGVSLSFGILDIVNIAHPAFIILGSYIAYIVNVSLGLDPILVSILATPAFYVLGAGIYQIYYVSFEKRGQESLRGLAFFFGLLFITEVVLVLYFGVDYRYVEAPYIGPTWHFGFLDIPLRILVPSLVSLLMIAVLQLVLTRTFIGRAIMAVAQDQLALKLMAVDPIRIKRIAFGISIASASLAGAFLIVIQPVEPSVGREYIGRVFAICVLGGMGSLPGTVIAAMLVGIVESLTVDLLRPVLGARGLVRIFVADAGGAAGRPVGTLDRALQTSSLSFV